MNRQLPGPIATIRTPHDMVAAVPVLLGFHPHDSVVVVAIKGAQVHFTARWDIAALEQPGGPRWLATRLRSDHRGRQVEGLDFFLAGYGEPGRARTALEAMVDQLGAAVVDAVVVDDDRWWFLEQSADSQAHGLSQSASGRPEANNQWIQSAVVLSSRDELAASIAAPSDQREEDMVQAWMEAADLIPGDPCQGARLVLTAMSDWRQGRQVSNVQYLAAGVAMAAGEVRDEIWRAVRRSEAADLLGFWQSVLTRTPHLVRLAPLAVTAMFAWLAGKGALMNICLEEAVAIDPGHSLVAMLVQISQTGLPPSCWEELTMNTA